MVTMKATGARLTPSFVKGVRRPGRYGDGRGSFGLSLLVRETSAGNLSTTYQQAVTVDGRKRHFGLGSTDALTLKQARELAAGKAAALRAPRLSAFDQLMLERYPQPSPVQQGAMDSPRTGPTFAEDAELTIADRRDSWKPGSRTEANHRAAFEQYAYPAFGDTPIAQVSASMVRDVILPIWHTKQDMAKKLKTGVGFVFTYAEGKDHIVASPMKKVDAGLAPQRKKEVRSHAAVHYDQLPEVIQHCRGSESYPALRLAAEFLALTAARPGEVAGATWDEIGPDERCWTIPAHRMKEEREHKIPLSLSARRVLYQAWKLTAEKTGSLLSIPDTPRPHLPIFPALRGGGSVRGDSIRKLLQRGGRFKVTAHGFRSSFRVWAAEQTDFPRDVAESALSHKVGNQVERAYLRTSFYDKRVELMEMWGDHATGGDHIHDAGLDDGKCPASCTTFAHQKAGQRRGR